MTLNQAAKLFLQAIIADGLSHKTYIWYLRSLGPWLDALGHMEISEITIHHLREVAVGFQTREVRYQNHPYSKPKSGGLSPDTVRYYLRSIKRLYNWLVEEEYLSDNQNVSSRLKLPKPAKRAPKGVSLDDVRSLLAAAAQGDDWLSLRDRAIVLFLYDTGCRAGGLVGLKLDGLHIDRLCAEVYEKGGEWRLVFFGDLTAAVLEQYLAARPFDSDVVFVGRSGDALRVDSVDQIFCRLKERAGVTGRCNPHSFRHAFAIHFIESGGDLATLKDLLGHSDIKVTEEFYARFGVDTLRKKHKKHSPANLLDDSDS